MRILAAPLFDPPISLIGIDWGAMDSSEFRSLGHEIVDLLSDYLSGVEGKALYPDVEPALLEKLFDEPLPRLGTEGSVVLAELREKLLPYCTHVNHPGYFGLITPTPTPIGILGDFIASALNQNIGAYSIGPSGVALERRVIRWLTDLAGYGDAASGNLTSGGMMANFTGLKLARDWASGDRAQREGLPEPGAVYVSEERHVSVDKAVDAVGIGLDHMRVLTTDAQFRVDLGALEQALARDRRDAVRPLCLVGMAGTTNTGAIDPLVELRRIADREKMWLHVDAAYGGGMLLSKANPGIPGLELADSITIDPHKWFYAPLDVGAILVRNGERLSRSFGLEPAYLKDNRGGEERYQFYSHGFEQSRRLRGLKVWMSLKRHGADTVGGWVDANVSQALRMYELVSASEDFEAATAPTMSAICIRYRPPGAALAPEAIERLHKSVAARLESDGRFWIGTTLLKGGWWFRICPVNFRTRLEHMDELFRLLQEECPRVLSSIE
jgi:glutamate/tyrosine decarboxylase-like PLP-dependent enzyme